MAARQIDPGMIEVSPPFHEVVALLDEALRKTADAAARCIVCP